MTKIGKSLGWVAALALAGCGGLSLNMGNDNSPKSGGTETPTEAANGAATEAASGGAATETANADAAKPTGDGETKTPTASSQPNVAGSYTTQEGKASIAQDGETATVTFENKLTATCNYAKVMGDDTWACKWKKGSDSGPAEMHIGRGQDDKPHLFGSWTKTGDKTKHLWDFLEPGHDFSKPMGGSSDWITHKACKSNSECVGASNPGKAYCGPVGSCALSESAPCHQDSDCAADAKPGACSSNFCRNK